jgi:Ca2+-binding RTX toxin-like protein
VSDTVDEDAIDGGAGIDTVITSLSNYSLGGLTVGPIENLTFNGSGGATLEGDPQANIIHGGAGDDIIVSHNGADTLYGGGGTTRFTAETGTLGMAVLDWSCTAEREMTSSRGSRVPARPPIQA